MLKLEEVPIDFAKVRSNIDICSDSGGPVVRKSKKLTTGDINQMAIVVPTIALTPSAQKYSTSVAMPSKTLDGPSTSKPKTAVVRYESQFNFSVFTQWPDKRFRLDQAPEILILCKGYIPPENEDNILNKCFTCFGTICRNRGNPYGLASLKPYIQKLLIHDLLTQSRIVRTYVVSFILLD